MSDELELLKRGRLALITDLVDLIERGEASDRQRDQLITLLNQNKVYVEHANEDALDKMRAEVEARKRRIAERKAEADAIASAARQKVALRVVSNGE